MAEIELVIGNIANILWGDWLLFALLGLGILYTFMTGGIQIPASPRHFPQVPPQETRRRRMFLLAVAMRLLG